MKSARENRWSADAEMCMQGFVIPVQDVLHAQYIVTYILDTIFPDRIDNDVFAESLVDTAMHKYASKKTRPVNFITVSTSPFGRLMTFVVDGKKLTKSDGSFTQTGNLCWVENLDAPDCSELGYCFFQKKNGKVVRYA